MVGREHCQLAQFFSQCHFSNQAVNAFHGFPAVQYVPLLRFFMPFPSPQC
jgi:hypothetical protein